jgi:hypothetical protein
MNLDDEAEMVTRQNFSNDSDNCHGAGSSPEKENVDDLGLDCHSHNRQFSSVVVGLETEV